LPLTLTCSPWHGGHGGGDLIAGNLADGEIPSVNRELYSGLTDRWGRLTRRGPLLAARARTWVQIWGSPSIFEGVFRKGLMKLISRKCENDSKNHILRFMTPKIVKQILVDFLGVDLWFKNVAY
jgi:hypothetical protein